MHIRVVHICMEMFKVLLSSAYKVRIEVFKVYQHFSKKTCYSVCELLSKYITHRHC